jgi:AcrR family transcriptional regulator
MLEEPPHQPPKLRQQRKAKTRKKILDAARDLFEQRGFEGTTMRAVASEAEVATGTIFTHFPDKGALLIAAILEDLAETDRQIAETLPPCPIRAQIRHMAIAGFAYWCQRPQLSTTLLREMYFITGPPAELRRKETVRFVGFCRSVLEQARDRGELRPDLDCETTAKGLYTYYIGRLVQAAGQDDFGLDAMLADLEAFVDQLLAGIAARKD